MRTARAGPGSGLLLWLFALAAFGLVAGPVLHPGLQLSYRDTARLYYPVKQLMAARLSAFELPLWDPWVDGGVSLLGQLSPGLFHPLTLLYLALPFDLAFKLNHLLTLPLAGVGTFLLAGRLGAGRGAALVGGLVYAGSGYLLSVASSNLPYAVGAAMVPFALAGLFWLLEKPGALRLLAASAALASCAWGGEPQSMFLSGVFAGAWVLARGAWGGAPGLAMERARRCARGLWMVGLWAGCALVLASPSLGPALAQMRRGERLVGLNAEDRGTFFNHPARLLGLLVPRVFDDTADVDAARPADSYRYVAVGTTAAFADSITLGAPALLLALCGLRAGRRGRFLLYGAALCALVSTGESLGLESLLLRLPGFGLFRYAEKFLGPCSLAVALAAALGTQEAFTRGPERTRWFAAVAAGAALLFLLGAPAVGAARGPLEGWLSSLLPEAPPDLAGVTLAGLQEGLTTSGVLLGLLGLIGLLAARRGSPSLGLWLTAATCAGAVPIWSSSLLWTAPVTVLRDPPALAARLLARAGPSAGRWRVQVGSGGRLPRPPGLDEHRSSMEAVVHALQPQTQALFGIEGFSRYFSLDDRLLLQLLEAAPGSLLPLFDVRFLVAMPSMLTSAQASRLGYTADPEGFWLQEHPPSPRAFLASAARAVPDAASLGRALSAPTFSPWNEVLVLPRDAGLVQGLDHPAGQPGPLPRWSRPAAERIEVDISSPGEAVLVFSEHFDPGWRATLDGAAAPVLAADGVVLGVRVGPGEHRVVLRFRPPWLWESLALGAALTAALLFAGFRPGARTADNGLTAG